MKQLGPFHLFFTLGCAEMRWPSVLVEVLGTVGNGRVKIHYNDNWDGSAEKITVTDVNENGELEEINGKVESIKPLIFSQWSKLVQPSTKEISKILQS